MELLKIYKNLYNYFGPQGWWPLVAFRAEPSAPRGKPFFNCDHQFEICVGAILTQNTAWKNVEKAIANLVKANLLTPGALLRCGTKKLQTCLYPAGYFRQKTKKLKIFSKFLLENYNGDLRKFFNSQVSIVRCQLLELWGIGPETADSMILYAGGKPTFVIDAYTRQLCECFGLRFKTYDEYKKFFVHQLPRRAKLYNQYHALIIAWGKLYSKDKKAALKILLL